MTLRQTVDPVVEENNLHVHVAPQAVHQVIPPNGKTVTIAGDHPDTELRPGQLEACGDSRCPAVDAVYAVGVHVIGEAAGAADAGDENQVLTRNPDLRQHLLHLRQNGVVATTWTPAHILVGDEILSGQLLLCQRFGHSRVPF